MRERDIIWLSITRTVSRVFVEISFFSVIRFVF